jgi:hypothetical protein
MFVQEEEPTRGGFRYKESSRVHTYFTRSLQVMYRGVYSTYRRRIQCRVDPAQGELGRRGPN